MIPLFQIAYEWDRLERHCANGQRNGRRTLRQRIRDHFSEFAVPYICLAAITLHLGARVLGKLIHG